MSIRKPSQVLQFNVAADINVTPMIDVMLVLLIIFMVVTPALAGASLPQARHAEYEKGKHPTLIIDANGQISLEVGPKTDRVHPRDLKTRLVNVYAARPNDHVLYLKADRNLQYTRVLTALEAARAAGVTRVAAITEKPRRDRRR
ncbi:MAG TPA: biopolymer transporter ExbD [Longimicrobium sp.]|nr:biopolymer transporter ExbD [Longimicrobium sp.]